MFTFAGSSASSRMQAMACAANASLSSIKSIWSMVRPARLSTFLVAGIGPRPMQLGSTPATAVATIRASGVGLPRPPAASRVTSNAAAPSLIPLVLAAGKAGTVGEGNHQELFGEHARLERCRGATLALDGEGILLGAPDLVAL